MIFFTSDNHFGHTRIIEYCNRPFSSVREMDETMIERWNAVVTDDDQVFHLGDFAFGKPEFIADILRRLKGQIVIIKGNHDRKMAPLRDRCDVKNFLAMRLDGFDLLLKHKPNYFIEHWHGAQAHLCGHVHTSWTQKRVADRAIYNVGVDVRDFTPVTLQQILNVAWEEDHANTD